MDTKKRSLGKGLTWRVTASVYSFILVYVFTKDIAASSLIGGLDFLGKLVMYYGHERLWANVKWGKSYE
jgi:uncharacterized membrane protein